MEQIPHQEERRKLAMRKSEKPAEENCATQPPVHRPVRKVDQNNSFAIVMAIVASVIVLGGGYLGFKHLHSQVQRISQIQAEKMESERESQKQQDKLQRLESKLLQIDAEAKAEQEVAKRVYISRLRSENDLTLNLIRNQINQAKQAGADKELNAINIATEKKIAAANELAAAIRKRDIIQEKLATIEAQNKEMKAWLRTHNATLHPNY